MTDEKLSVSTIFTIIQMIAIIAVALRFEGKTIGEIYLTNLIGFVILVECITMGIIITFLVVILLIISR